MEKNHMSFFIHLSDLHFDSIQDKDFELIVNHKAKVHPLAKKLYDDIRSNVSPIEPPICVVISGDLTKEAKVGEFKNVTAFCVSLTRLFTDKTPDNFIFIVPGNHDIMWGENIETYSNTHFENFYKSLYQNRINDLNKLLIKESGVLIYGLNSCSKETHRNPGVGYVQENELANIEQDLLQNNFDLTDVVKVAVLHHHLLPVCNYRYEKTNKRNFSILTNADAVLQKLSKLNFSIVLHGHMHHYYQAVYKRYFKSTQIAGQIVSNPLAIIGSGSLIRNDEQGSIMFNVIEISNRKPPSYYFKVKTRISNYESQEFHADFEIPLTVTQFPEIIDANEIIDMALSTNTEEEILETFSLVLNICLKTANIDNGFIGIYDKTIERIKVVAMSDKTPNEMKQKIVGDIYKIGQGVTGHAFKSKSIITTNDVLNDNRFSRKHQEQYSKIFKANTVSCLASPIFDTNSNVSAIINIARPNLNEDSKFDSYEVLLWRHLCNTIAPAINILVQKEESKQYEKDLELIENIQKELGREGSMHSILNNILLQIKSTYKLNEDDGEAAAFILNEGNDYYTAAFWGFKTEIRYTKGEGLTGGVIQQEKFDVCLDHLHKNLSLLGNKTTAKCLSSYPKKEEMNLSFFGHPIFVEHEAVGALIFNVVTPRGADFKSLEHLIARYKRILSITSKLVSYRYEKKLKK